MPRPKEIVVNDKIFHVSVGALIESDEKYLLIERAIPPRGFAGVAGHVDEGETPGESLLREVQEEVGLRLKKYELLLEEAVHWNWCNAGVTGHYWYLYRALSEGEIKRNDREVSSVQWYTKEEINKLNLEPVWAYWFKKLKVL